MRLLHLTFATADRMDFALNWARHLVRLRETAVVGLMEATDEAWRIAIDGHEARLERVDTFLCRSRATSSAQSSRWACVLEYARAHATQTHIFVSDVDVVWTRSPIRFWKRVLREHPRLDLALSSDAIFERAKDDRRGDTLDVPHACWASLNIGIIGIRANRPNALLALQTAARAVRASRLIDQAAINREWKRDMLLRDGLCLVQNRRVAVGVLPTQRFCNSLLHAIGSCHRPFATHATWMRTQEAAVKRWRLAELALWDEAPAERTMSYEPLPPPDRVTLDKRGVPVRHVAHMRALMRQLHNALALARERNRTLILPPFRCACETGLWNGHVKHDCRAHSTTTLPMRCPIDALFIPSALPAWLRSARFPRATDHETHRVDASSDGQARDIPWASRWCCAANASRADLSYYRT